MTNTYGRRLLRIGHRWSGNFPLVGWSQSPLHQKKVSYMSIPFSQHFLIPSKNKTTNTANKTYRSWKFGGKENAQELIISPYWQRNSSIDWLTVPSKTQTRDIPADQRRRSKPKIPCQASSKFNVTAWKTQAISSQIAVVLLCMHREDQDHFWRRVPNLLQQANPWGRGAGLMIKVKPRDWSICIQPNHSVWHPCGQTMGRQAQLRSLNSDSLDSKSNTPYLSK